MELQESSDDNVFASSDDEPINICYPPTKKNVIPGAFVLIRVMSGKRNIVPYRYVCTIQELQNKSEVKVMGCVSVSSDQVIFKPQKDGIFIAGFDDIISVLPQPSLDNTQDRIRYRFEGKIDVKEK